MVRLFLQVMLLTLLTACARKYQPSLTQYQGEVQNDMPDYSRLEHWAAHPYKKDPADSVPAPLVMEKRDSLVDVFFIYPTTYTGSRLGWNASINDKAINAKTDYSTILYQASVFNQHARVFAPRYRQAHLSAFFTDDPQAQAAFDTAYADLRQAFEVYLKTYQQGRPLIIAGHSQGGKMALRLLKDFFDNKALKQKLVAAYIVGWPVPMNSFDSIPVCGKPSQNGCFCSWRTFRQGYMPDYVKEEKPPAQVTNPLSWTTDGDLVGREQNKGSILRDFNQIIPATTDAQIHDGVLWVNKPKFPGSLFFTTKNYHIGDINLYYINIRQNIEQRIFAFLGKE